MNKTCPLSIDQNSQLPYSVCVKLGDINYFSGTLPNIGNDKKLISIDVSEQTRQIIAKMKKYLEECRLSLNDVFGVTIMLKSMDDYTVVNEIYAEAFKDVLIKPRRKTFGVAGLPFGALIEIEFEASPQE